MGNYFLRERQALGGSTSFVVEIAAQLADT